MVSCVAHIRSTFSIQSSESKLFPCQNVESLTAYRLETTEKKNQKNADTTINLDVNNNSLKSSDSLCIYIIIVFLALILYWCEIEQDTYWGIGEAHVIP